MSRRKKILVSVAAGIPALLVIVIIAAILVMRTAWFSNYVREKIVAVTEESTGGVVEVGSFQFDWTHLTARIRNFVLHGTEPKGSDPLARIALLEVRLKLFSGFKKMVDLRYLGITQPQVNLIVFPDGKANIPQPKVAKKPSETSGLETVVNLAIGEFQITNGLLQFSQQKTSFSARGENLRVLLNYNAINPGYQGNLSIDPLLLTSERNPPLNVHVNLPVAIEKDAVRIAGATLNTAQSKIDLNGSIQNMKAPQISAQVKANISLPEMQRSFALPLDTNAKGTPRVLTADLSAVINQQNKTVQIQTARLELGETTLQASGTLDPSRNEAARFNVHLALDQLARLLKFSGVELAGALDANGAARLDSQNNYAVDGTLNSKNLSVRSQAAGVTELSLHSPFHADPYLISMDGLKLGALGGTLAAKVFIEKMQRLSVEGNLRNFSLGVLSAAFAGKRLGYDGTIDGSIKASGDLKARGTTGYRAQARLAILPGHAGVPLSGHLYANYVGATGAVDLDHSYLAMPNSRIDLAGSLNKQIDVRLLSHNLNDFLPLANMSSSTPESSLPVTLANGGVADLQAHVTGDLSAPHINSRLEVDRFEIEKRSFDRLALELAASPSGATVRNGLLSRKTLRTTFDASLGLRRWKPEPRSALAANLSMRNGDLADILSLAGENPARASGNLSADVHLNGTYGNPLGNAILQLVNGSAYDQPIDRLFASVILSDQLVNLSTLEFAAAGGRIDANGTFRHPRDSFTVGRAQLHIATNNVQLANIIPLQQESPGTAGAIQLTADAAADVREVDKKSEVTISNVTADFSGRGLRVQNQAAGDVTATVRTANRALAYNLVSDFAGSRIDVNGHTALTPDYATTATASIQNLAVEKALLITGQSSIPVSGNFSANARVSGTLKAPNADLTFALANAKAYQERIDRLQGSVRYSNALVDIPSIELNVPAGSVTLAGSFSHPANDFAAGALKLNLRSTGIQLQKIEHIRQVQPSMAGTLRMAADLSANLRERNGERAVLVSNLNADIAANSLRLNGRDLGQAGFTARTTGSNLNFRFDSDIAASQIHATGQSQLVGDYPTRASLAFSNIRYSSIAPFISSEPTVQPAFDALVEGQASVDGPLLKPDELNGRLQLNRLEAKTAPQRSPTGAPPGRMVDFQNSGPIVIALNHSVVEVQHFLITGPGTNVNVSGSVNWKNARAPLGITVKADADLGVLQDVDREFYSSGGLSVNATLRGTFAQPLVNGRVELKNANVNYAEAPNGLSNANGVILLNGTSASIEKLSGESGGGRIEVSGFVGYTGPTVNYNLRAAATKVRVRSSGVSVTSNAAIRLIGSARRSFLTGNVTVQRIEYGSSGDVGSILSAAGTPPSTPSAPSPLLAGMRLDIHIRTAPDLRVVTTYADRLSVEANLTVRGTAANPGMLGHVNITDGQLVFFGNQYTVNTGTVNFYDPNSIQPVLNISLETIAQNVDVVIGVSGPINNLNLSYRSDPPLTFQQIVQLLATNTTPADPTIAAHQPAPPQQSFTQMGESAILGQAVADPLASRVQRVFGITQFKIDPSISGSGGQPNARVTLQQKIASNITFTYITDVTETNSEIVRVEWAFTPRFSAVAMRDFNGNVSLEFFYKFKKR